MMTNEQFLRRFTDVIKGAFEREGPDFGELLLSVYLILATAQSVRASQLEALNRVLEEYAAKSRAAYQDGEASSVISMKAIRILDESGAWKLVRRRPPNEWPDEL